MLIRYVINSQLNELKAGGICGIFIGLFLDNRRSLIESFWTIEGIFLVSFQTIEGALLSLFEQ